MHMQEPAVGVAAALILHWSRRDIEAAVLMIADIKDKEEALDVITALLILRDRALADLPQIALR